MLQVIYTSSAETPPSKDDLAALCEQAARNNKRHEITGMLCAIGNHYIQVLEGPRVPVEDTFIRIITDPRHHSLIVLSRRMLNARQFGSWSMSVCDGPGGESDLANQIGQLLQNSPPRLRQLFEERFRPGQHPAPRPAARLIPLYRAPIVFGTAAFS